MRNHVDTQKLDEKIKDTLDSIARPRGYSCTRVSWEDSQRFAQSSIGPNISDVRIIEKRDPKKIGTPPPLYVLRSENWNERIAIVKASQIDLVVKDEDKLCSVSLADYLANAQKYANYSGLTTSSLSRDTENSKNEPFSIRFQCVFLSGDKEFNVQVYNYNTRDAESPSNYNLLCTSQGVSIAQDRPGRNNIYFHDVNNSGVTQRFLKAESSGFAIGQAQSEDNRERASTEAKSKAVAHRLGIKGTGEHFDRQLLIQLPLQKSVERRHVEADGPGPQQYSDALVKYIKNSNAPTRRYAADGAGSSHADASCYSQGETTAARLSMGEMVDTLSRGQLLAKKDVKRDSDQRGTITVTMYYVVQNGIPKLEDVEKAVAILDEHYRMCGNCSERVRDSNKAGIDVPASAQAVAAVVAAMTKKEAQEQTVEMKQVSHGVCFWPSPKEKAEDVTASALNLPHSTETATSASNESRAASATSSASPSAARPESGAGAGTAEDVTDYDFTTPFTPPQPSLEPLL